MRLSMWKWSCIILRRVAFTLNFSGFLDHLQFQSATTIPHSFVSCYHSRRATASILVVIYFHFFLGGLRGYIYCWHVLGSPGVLMLVYRSFT